MMGPSFPGSLPLHLHRQQFEHVEVLRGTLGYVLGGVNATLAAGGRAVFPAAAPHFAFAAGGADVQLRMELRPALRGWELHETLTGLGRDYGRLDGAPPLQLLLTATEAGAEVAGPAAGQAVVEHLLCPLARWLGYRPFYDEYAVPRPPAAPPGVVS